MAVLLVFSFLCMVCACMCVCVCACLSYLPMVLGSEVSWLSSTFNVVSFFNIPLKYTQIHIGIQTRKADVNTHLPLKCPFL